MILRVDARSATGQENTSYAVTRPRMVAEFVVAFTDPGSFWYPGAAASLLLDGRICSVIEHQQDQLMYQQMVIDEAGAARTPVHQYAQEYRGKQVDLRIGNEPETLAVDEKLYAELAGVEANTMGELSSPEMNDAREKRVKQLAFMLMMHTTISGRVALRSISSDADAVAAMSSHGKQRSSLGGVATSCTAVRGAEFGHAPGHNQSSNTGTQPTGFAVLQIRQTERDETEGA